MNWLHIGANQQLFQADLTTSSRLSKLLSSCASVATIVGIIFAAQNLLLWRKQFTYKKLDEVLEEIEESIHELVAAYHKTWTAKFNYLIKTSGDVTPEEKIRLNKIRRQSTLPLIELIVSYRKMERKLQHHVQLNDSHPLRLSYLQNASLEVTNLIDEDFASWDLVPTNSEFDPEIEMAERAAKVEEEMNNALFDLRRKLLPVIY